MSEQASANPILADVKAYLHITWQDDQTDALIQGYIDRGMQRLQDIAGAPLDFLTSSLPYSLLLDYCRYANSQALEVFEQNFGAQLLELHQRSQAPLIDDLTVIIDPGSTPGGATLRVVPALSEDDGYVVKVGAGLTLPATADVCAPPDWTEWDGVSPIVAESGQQIIVVEVSDAYQAVRAGAVTMA